MAKDPIRLCISGTHQLLGALVLDLAEADRRVGKIIALSDRKPLGKRRKVEFVQMDPRERGAVDLFEKHRVDAVCHLDFALGLEYRDELFERNVFGAMNLLGAAARAGARKFILPSSTFVYGARHTNPTYLEENRRISLHGKMQYLREWGDIERHTAQFLRSHQSLAVTILRFPHIVGARVDTPMTRYLALKRVPTLLGFDPLLQVLHEEDAARALLQAVHADVAGPCNVAPPGIIPLSKVLQIARKKSLSVFHPVLYLAETIAPDRSAIPLLKGLPLDLDHLRYSCVGDTTRMRQELRFHPKYTHADAIKDYVQDGNTRKRTR